MGTKIKISPSTKRMIQEKEFYSVDVLKHAHDFITVYKTKNNEALYMLDTKKMLELDESIPEYNKWRFDDKFEVLDVDYLPDKLFFNNNGCIMSQFLDHYYLFYLHYMVDVCNIINSRMLVDYKLSMEELNQQLPDFDPFIGNVLTDDLNIEGSEDKLDKIIDLLTSIDSKLDSKKEGEKELKSIVLNNSDVIPQPKEIIQNKSMQVDVRQLADNLEATNMWLNTKQLNTNTIVDPHVFTTEMEYLSVLNYLRDICARCIHIIKDCQKSDSIDKSVSGIKQQASEAINALKVYLATLNKPKSECDFMENQVVKNIIKICSLFLNSSEFAKLKDGNLHDAISKFLLSFDKLDDIGMNKVVSRSIFTLFVDTLIFNFNIVRLVLDRSNNSNNKIHEYTLEQPFTLQLEVFGSVLKHINLYYKTDLIINPANKEDDIKPEVSVTTEVINQEAVDAKLLSKPTSPMVSPNTDNDKTKEDTKESIDSEMYDLKQEWNKIFKKETEYLINSKNFNVSDYNNIINYIEDLCVSYIDTMLYSKYRIPNICISVPEITQGTRDKVAALENYLMGIDNPKINITPKVQELCNFMCELVTTYINGTIVPTLHYNDWDSVCLFLINDRFTYDDFKGTSMNEKNPEEVAHHKYRMYRLFWFFIVDTLINKYNVCELISPSKVGFGKNNFIYDSNTYFKMRIDKGKSDFEFYSRVCRILPPAILNKTEECEMDEEEIASFNALMLASMKVGK